MEPVQLHLELLVSQVIITRKSSLLLLTIHTTSTYISVASISASMSSNQHVNIYSCQGGPRPRDRLSFAQLSNYQSPFYDLMIISYLPFNSPAVEEVLDPETDLLVPERTYGCLPADEQVSNTIIIIFTRPRPAFGRLGLGGLSRGYSSHG